MEKKQNKSLFSKNSNNTENQSKIINLNSTISQKKFNNKLKKSIFKTRNKDKKKISDLKKLKILNFMGEEEEYDNPYDSEDLDFKKPHNKRRNNTISNFLGKNNIKNLRNKINNNFRNALNNNELKTEVFPTIQIKKNIFKEKEKRKSIEKNNNLYIEQKRKECKSYTIDALKKNNKIKKYNNLLYKDNEKKFIGTTIIKDLNIDSFPKTFYHNNTNKLLKMQNSIKSIDNNNKEQNKIISINPYKAKSIFYHSRNLGNKNSYLFSPQKFVTTDEQTKNLNLINNHESKDNIKIINLSNESIHQENLTPKKNSKLFIDFPIIKNEKITKTEKKLTKRKKKSNLPLSNFFKNYIENDKVDSSLKKTTINIYNNKINNINNIILNDKNSENQSGKKDKGNKEYNNEKEENESLKSSALYDNENMNNKSSIHRYKQLNFSKNDDEEDEESDEEKNNYEEKIENRVNRAKKINKIRKVKISSNNERNKDKKNKKKNISKSYMKYKSFSKKKNLKNPKLIKRLSVNFTNNFFNPSQILSYQNKNIDKMEKKIREKILRSYPIRNNSIIEMSLNKTKKDIIMKLFEEFSKKISNDIEEEEKNYTKKEKIIFDQNILIKVENKYILKVHKKTEKLIKKIDKLIYSLKNKLIQINENNIDNYYKIKANESKYLFPINLFNECYHHINDIIFNNKNKHKNFKNNSLSNFYKYNLNNESFSLKNSIINQNENYYHSLISKYLLMEKDKIQNFPLNNVYIDNTINQIKTLIKRPKTEKYNSKIKNFIIKENKEKDKNKKQNKNDFLEDDNFVKRNSIKKFTFFKPKKSELSDNDKIDNNSQYEIKSRNSKKIITNYKSKTKVNNFYNKENNILFPKSRELYRKKNTFNNKLYKTNFYKIINNNYNINDLEKQNSEKKYNLTSFNLEDIEKKYDQKITKSINYFFKRRKNLTNKKKASIHIQKKEYDFLKGNYLLKNILDYKTDQIKINIQNNIKSPVEMLFYHIKEHNFDEFIELFERKHIDINSRNNENDSFLIYAVKCKEMNFVVYLLKKGINVNLENKLGNTALHYAFSDQNFSLADVLLQHGADEFKKNVFGQTPWQCLGQNKIYY